MFRGRKCECHTICALLTLLDGAAWRGVAPNPCIAAFMCLTVCLRSGKRCPKLLTKSADRPWMCRGSASSHLQLFITLS